MAQNLVDSLKQRGMIHDIMPGTRELLSAGMVTAYVGFDPTADSLHIGHLVSIMLLRHLQAAGHRPIALIGGATGMVGDPSGKSCERNLLDPEELLANQDAVARQLERFLDPDPPGGNAAMILNNHDWLGAFNLLDFLRMAGKHLTVNYMMAKESVKNRLESGLSFTEFSYQLLQAWDFFHLYTHHDCRLQMGGSDQWGNITAGTELIRRKAGGEAFALTCPLITRADGRKFGKTESGNVWLDPRRTSPYQFYQFWLNVSDIDAARYMRIFTHLDMDEIAELTASHMEAPHRRLLQQRLGREATEMVHSHEAWESARAASEILFGRGSTQTLRSLSEADLLDALEGVPRAVLPRTQLEKGVDVVDMLAVHTDVFASKGEVRRLVGNGGLSLNRERVADPSRIVSAGDLLHNRFILVQQGKKHYILISVE
ncbi:MAG TPA: tyrosine--tRNA ligase [Candidatus Aminicenantes bacterium]|nr:tyrosine--tRNA ligase [Candidatus Aminicenantes bacterium]